MAIRAPDGANKTNDNNMIEMASLSVVCQTLWKIVETSFFCNISWVFKKIV